MLQPVPLVHGMTKWSLISYLSGTLAHCKMSSRRLLRACLGFSHSGSVGDGCNLVTHMQMCCSPPFTLVSAAQVSVDMQALMKRSQLAMVIDQ